MAALQGLLLLSLSISSSAAETAAPEGQVAQSSDAPGRVSSVLYRDLPEGFPVEVITFDDTKANLDILERIGQELEKAGHVVAENAPLEFSFTTDVLQAGMERRQPSLGRIGASTEQDRGTRGAESGVEAELNVWSSTQDSVLGGRQQRKAGDRHARYRISAQLRDRDSGQVLWQGDATYTMTATADRDRLARSMVGPLIDSYGRSVKDEPFELE